MLIFKSFSALLALICIGAASICSTAWAVDEKMTATAGKAIASEDKEFNAAMRIWYSHRYEEASVLLRKFVKQHPNSRWAAEAEMHVGCKLVYERKFDEARPLFAGLIAKHADDEIGLKAKMRPLSVAFPPVV